MKVLAHPLTSAFGLSVLCCLVLISPLVGPSHPYAYHSSSSLAPVFVAVFLFVAVLWLVWGVLLVLARRWPRLQVATWTGILVLAPWCALTEVAALTGRQWGGHRGSLLVLWVPIICCSVLRLGWRRRFLELLCHAQRFLAALLGVYALYSTLLLVQLLWTFWQYQKGAAPPPLHHPVAEASAQPHPSGRIIWIVLDELSYQQVYGQRFAGLDLPSFDRIAGQGTVFTHVLPAGIFTESVLPSLITGLPVDALRSSADGGRVALHNSNTDRWQAFDPHQSVFQDALNAGYHTAVVGWFNPYCRILPEVLDQCYWRSRVPTELGMHGDLSVFGNVLAPFRRMMRMGLYFLGFSKRPQNVDNNQLHLADYRELFAHADERLEDSSASFLFLHMPVPHPMGIYDRKRHVFVTENASYLDNLALADQYLGHVASVLQQRNEWDSSTIVVMGDHSWRAPLLWVRSSGWTREDGAASHGGQFDDRPGYIVKLPYQTQGTKIDTPFPALRTRALLQGILSGRIRSSADLAAFAKEAKGQ